MNRVEARDPGGQGLEGGNVKTTSGIVWVRWQDGSQGWALTLAGTAYVGQVLKFNRGETTAVVLQVFTL